MADPTTAQIAAVSINAGVIITSMVISQRLNGYLRKHHPLIWSGFGFPADSPFVKDEHEKADIHAGFSLSEYVRSGKWRELGDARLARLILARRVSFYTACVTMIGCGVVLFSGL